MWQGQKAGLALVGKFGDLLTVRVDPKVAFPINLYGPLTTVRGTVLMGFNGAEYCEIRF